MKAANFAPWYAALYPQFAEIARKHGYALAVHGSMARDFDVIAIPWRQEVSTPRQVLDDVLSQFAVDEIGEPTLKEHGRLAYTISIGFGDCFADWSFMPATPPTEPANAAKMVAGDEQIQRMAEAAYEHVADEPLGDLTQRREAVQRSWRDAMRAALAALQPDHGEREA